MSTEQTLIAEPAPAPVPDERVSAGGRAGSGTTVPQRAERPKTPEVRRTLTNTRRTDVFALLGAATAAVSLTILIFSQLAPFDGPLGFVVVSYLVFLGLYALLVSLDESGPAVQDRLVAAIVHSLAFLMLLALVVVIGFTLFKGREPLSHLNFYLEDARQAGPLEPLSIGGIRHAMIGTLQQITIALAITIPLGILCAVFLSELPGPFSRFVRIIVEAMTALPSIVAGLFIYATVILALGELERRGRDLPLIGQKSGFAAALAISVMMLPIIIRAADVVLRLVPGTLREASYALGASQWRTIWHVVLPTARSGAMTAIILGTARGIGETSPVLLTAGFTQFTNVNPGDGPQVSLPLFTFDAVRRPDEVMIARGFGAATVLMALVLLLFVLARLLGGRAPGQLSRGQRRRRAIASRRDALRFARRERERLAAAPRPGPDPDIRQPEATTR
ncbi:phosphate ABC transporter permease PstA [Micromonospora sp. WMMD812]|uniref:phosphate ABC transporter permease PstA n=1 Tax=Micromonospora sp. WMMD812 TaxID=3015152 RepID=UPI00248AB766|nr:phosphate ABC transporter permease PstA [Micromonospora sp. WMMD812]WBB65475.1 phosphate ABC transporter permease PstA [Micromonospora sp. WMMD812]